MNKLEPTEKTRFIKTWIVPLIIAVFWMLLVKAIHWDSPRTLVSFHGFIHTAIAERFLGPHSFNFPPENPFFSGRPVAYYWFFQFLASRLVRFFGLNVFYSLEMIILIAMGTMMIVAVRLGRIIHRSTLAGVLIGYLIVAGTNPFGFIFAIIKSINFIHRMGVQVLHTSHTTYLWGVVHPIYSLIRFNDFGGLYGPLLNFFLNNTSRPAALASLLLVIFCLERVLRTRRILDLVSLGIASAICTAFSPVIGIPSALSLLAGTIVCFLWTRFEPGGLRPKNLDWQPLQLVYICFAVVAGILIAAPTYYHLLIGPSESRMHFWLFSADGMKRLVTVVLSISFLMLLAIAGIIAADQKHKPYLKSLLLAALILLTASIMIVLPEGNQCNFFHAAVVLLSVPAAGSIFLIKPSIKVLSTHTRCAALIILFYLPTLLLLLAAYVNRPPLPIDFRDALPKYKHADSDKALLYRWVRHQTDDNAIFIIDPRYRVAMCGNIDEFPTMTGRTIFTEQLEHYMVEPYPDAKMRFDMSVRLVSGKEPVYSDRTYISNINRPVYILNRQVEKIDISQRMTEIYGPPVYHKGNVFVFKWRE
jgi:hypothetical protein